jgi:FkbM family methyltransferase
MTQSEPFVSYAQNSEDVVLARALCPDDQPGFWIDVGAGDPVIDSVTAAFSERGWNGINVEPCPTTFARLVETRADDVNLSCALGERAGFAKVYPGPDGHDGLTTLVAAIAEMHYETVDEVPAPYEVEVRTLAEIVEQHAPPVVDFLKVDVEGSERSVLAGADWTRFRPRVVVVEATAPNSREARFSDWEPLLIQRGYRFTLFDGLNRFYVAEEAAALGSDLSAPANVSDNFVPDLWRRRDAAAAAAFREVDEYAASLDAEMRTLAREVRHLTNRVSNDDELIEGLQDDLAVSQLRAARAMDRAATVDRELAGLRATRTFRYTERARNIYSLLRRLSGRPT